MFRVKQTKIELGMDEVAFTTKNHLLETYGVTTCIAIAMRGSFYNEHGCPIKFCGVWHWSGFSAYGRQPTGEEILETFFIYAQQHLNFKKNTVLYLEELRFIGGEKEQRDEKGELLLSGTEQEVNALKGGVTALDNLSFSVKIDPLSIHWHNFITHDDMSLTVKVQLDAINFVIEENNSLSSEDEKEKDCYLGVKRF